MAGLAGVICGLGSRPGVGAPGRLLLSAVRGDFPRVVLTGFQGDQSLVAVVGDADNSLSMRWVKFGSRGAMNHASGSGTGWHSAERSSSC